MRYFIGFLITIGLIIVLIILLFSGGGNDNKRQGEKQPPRTTSQLADYASSGAVARLTIDGPIVADQNHQAIRITVGQNDVVYEQIQGYEGRVINQQTYANNQSAYSNFLYALGRSGFTLGNNDKTLANEKGYCPLGSRYVYELIDGDDSLLRWWSTSCSKPKTYKGNVSTTLDLFRAQVPDYQSLTRDLNLGGSGFSF